MTDMSAKSRLSTLQAAFVIARRDFMAILFSRTFIFFLLGPLFPLLVGGLAGGIGSEVRKETGKAEIGVAMSAADTAAMLGAWRTLEDQLGGEIPPMADASDIGDPRKALVEHKADYAAIVSGTPAAPEMVGPRDQIGRWKGTVGLVAATAAGGSPSAFPDIATEIVATSGANVRTDRVQTAQGGQLLLFLLTMLLAGMVLSNLVEEKSNKIIEVLAAAIPMDAVFLGKLFAMLGVSFVGIAVWGSAIGLIGSLGEIGSYAAPAVGWPLFVALGIAYFAMAYLLLGSLFLAIGSLATTVREVQTLSMPVTMLQLMVFLFSSYALAKPGSPAEIAATVFPFSSPFAMLARAAQFEPVWPHLVALGWQALCVAVFVRTGAALFKRRVMKSGGAGRKKRGLFRRGDRSLIDTGVGLAG